MTDERTLDRMMAHLRGQVVELRRLERNGAAPDDTADRKRLILYLQEHLAYAVRDLLNAPKTSAGQVPPPRLYLMSQLNDRENDESTPNDDQADPLWLVRPT
jgi:hypothetical protein